MNNNKVLHFSGEFKMDDISSILNKNQDVIYYTRYIEDKKELHIVNHKKGEFNIMKLISELFNHYKKDEQLAILLSNIKMKGNMNFTIINNIDEEFANKLKNDLNNLLKK